MKSQIESFVNLLHTYKCIANSPLQLFLSSWEYLRIPLIWLCAGTDSHIPDVRSLAWRRTPGWPKFSGPPV